MQKRLSMKVIIIILALAAAVAASVFAILHFTKGTETFRSIQIYELEGKADIEREGSGSIKAAENLYLQSGDRVSTAAESFMRLKLDEDKYIMAEENSVFSIEAEGSDEDSKTKIILEEGAITNEIQNKLSSDSLYEVNTPNSVMAVRGTIFRMEMTEGEDDMLYTKLTVLEGTVSTRLYQPDGSLGEEVLTEAGKETIIRSDGEEAVFDEISRDTVFEELPLQALQVVQGLADEGADMRGISRTELKSLMEDRKEEEMKQGGEKEDAEDVQDDASDKEPENGDNGTNVSNASSSSDGTKKPSSSGGGSKKVPQTTKAAQGNENGGAGSKPEADNPSNTGSQGNGSSGNRGNQNQGSQTPGGNPGNDGNQNQSGGSETIEKKTYTVTFMYEGKVFGTQTVENGHRASVPLLMPETAGSWDFDFSKPIEADTVIYWKPQP